MRVIGGNLRGKTLASIGKGDLAAHLRPTQDRVRENIFNLLQNAQYDAPLYQARVLDLFAGSGALGIEAFSRGASFVTFVDNGQIAQRILRENITNFHLQDHSRLLKKDAMRLGSCPDQPYDLIFLDPPYGKMLGQHALTHLWENGWIAPSALIIWEEEALQTDIPPFLVLRDHRKYGRSVIQILSLA